MTDELKPLPCPFCGGTEVRLAEGSTFRWRELSCNACGATCGETRVQTMGTGTHDEWEKQVARDAIRDWNRRAQPAAPAGFWHEKATEHAAMNSVAFMDAAPSVAPEPVAWLSVDCIGERYLCFSKPMDNDTVTPLFAHPPRAPLTEEIESADNLLRHLGLDPERCRTVGGSLNVSRIKTLLADAAPTARESAMEELLRSAAAIAQRHGAGTAWDRFGASIKALGIGAITARTYRLLPSDTERQQPPTTDPSRLADDLSNIGTMSPRIRKLYDDAAAFIRSTQAPLTPWQSMETAPKDGAEGEKP